MKKLLMIALLALTASCGTTRTFTYDALKPIAKTIKLDTDKDFNYIRANEWMVENFVSAEDVIQFTDKEAGVVKGKYLFKKGFTTPVVHYGYGITGGGINTPSQYAIITIRVKDSGATIEIHPPSEKFTTRVSMGKEIGFSPVHAANKIKSLMHSFILRMGNDYDRVEEHELPPVQTKKDLFRKSKDHQNYLKRAEGKSNEKKIKLYNLYYNRWISRY